MLVSMRLPVISLHENHRHLGIVWLIGRWLLCPLPAATASWTVSRPSLRHVVHILLRFQLCEPPPPEGTHSPGENGHGSDGYPCQGTRACAASTLVVRGGG